MKALIVSVLLVSASATAFADTYYEEVPPRRVIVEPRYEPRPFARRDYDWRAHRERNAGMALTIVGIGAAVLSTGFAVWAPAAATRFDYNEAVTGAVVTGIAAGMLLIPGIPLWVDGQSRINAYEGRRLSLRGGAGNAPGTTLALSF